MGLGPTQVVQMEQAFSGGEHANLTKLVEEFQQELENFDFEKQNIPLFFGVLFAIGFFATFVFPVCAAYYKKNVQKGDEEKENTSASAKSSGRFNFESERSRNRPFVLSALLPVVQVKRNWSALLSNIGNIFSRRGKLEEAAVDQEGTLTGVTKKRRRPRRNAKGQERRLAKFHLTGLLLPLGPDQVSDDEEGKGATHHKHYHYPECYEGASTVGGRWFSYNCLPEELVLHVLHYLDDETVTQTCKLLCKSWYYACRDPVMWKHRLTNARRETSWLFGKYEALLKKQAGSLPHPAASFSTAVGLRSSGCSLATISAGILNNHSSESMGASAICSIDFAVTNLFPDHEELKESRHWEEVYYQFCVGRCWSHLYEGWISHREGLQDRMAIHGKVYNLTEFGGEHPGGLEVLEEFIGKDATAVFEEVGHTQSARVYLRDLYVGQALPSRSAWKELSGLSAKMQKGDRLVIPGSVASLSSRCKAYARKHNVRLYSPTLAFEGAKERSTVLDRMRRMKLSEFSSLVNGIHFNSLSLASGFWERAQK